MWLTRALACAFLLAGTVACDRATPRAPAADPVPATSTAPAQTEGSALPAVVFLGDSLTAGLGVAPELAFPALVQQRIDAAGLRFRVVNAGVSGDTSAGGLRRIDWLLREPLRVLVLELGANDMLRGQDVAAMRSNLQQIIEHTRARYPDARIVLAGMQSAPNLGPSYARSFAESFSELAREQHATLIPFLLEGVAGVPALNQADGIHPTAEGHRHVADTVWSALEPVLREQ